MKILKYSIAIIIIGYIEICFKICYLSGWPHSECISLIYSVLCFGVIPNTCKIMLCDIQAQVLMGLFPGIIVSTLNCTYDEL